MPELPDITVYVEALESRLLNQTVNELIITSHFLMRTAVPDIQEIVGQPVTSVQRLGKRVVLGFPQQRWFVLHLMIAGRLHWYKPGAKVPTKSSLLQLHTDAGVLTLTEAGSKKRASLHFLDGDAALAEINPGGLEIPDSTLAEFSKKLTQSNHTLKRALTSPSIFSGIGNAYSDEILHCARLSPISMSQKLTPEQIESLHTACNTVLADWTKKLRLKAGESFPKKVTAFRDGMSVHGRYGKACPVCSTQVQRIRYVGRETNYCPRCQTNGKVLADRSLSRLLKSDWPRTIEELEKK